MEIRALVEALRRPLLFAARDGFAGIDQVKNLGATLRAACDRLVAGPLPPERLGPVRAWRRALERFEALGREEQEIEVARGLRLCVVLLGERAVGAPGGAVAGAGQEAAAAAMGPPAGPLEAPVTSLPGIGPTLGARLRERGIETIEDLIWLVPRRYDDLRHVRPLAEVAAQAVEGERVTLVGTVSGVTYSRWRRRYLQVKLVDADVRLTIRWFHVAAGMAARFAKGARVVVSGKLRRRDGAWEMANPDLLGDPEDDAAARAVIRPRYPEIEGVAAGVLRKACRAAVERGAAHVVDGVPPEVAGRMGLSPLREALTRLHAPPADLAAEEVAALDAGESPWHRRLAFDELFFLGLAVARRREAHRRERAVPCPAPAEARAAIERALPFALTGAQRRAIDAIAADLARPEPMNRLLQGDVGSGKTAVAFAAAHLAAAAGRQVAIMAPTEILAEQHLGTLEPWARALGHRAALLTASTPRGVRESLFGMLAAGAIAIVIGTHALLAERVEFADLGLVVIDEQHRFGVAQRLRLRAKGETMPHLLVMTATPIPRTLALTIYGDLEVTTLDEMPPGREPPDATVFHGAAGRKKAYELLRRELRAGARAFVVCPLVEPSEEDTGWADATTSAERLAEELAPARVGLVHGRMPVAERDAAMARLRAGELDVLVATTVIEVGVDVPEARVMLIEDADRFGLAQLHQLRGRVGRGGGRSRCLLLTKGARTSEAARRLAIMEETSDGFRIAEEDLAIRGPGELLGARQAGLPRLRFGNLVTHAALAADARREADRVLAADPDLARPEHAAARRVLEERVAAAQAIGAESG